MSCGVTSWCWMLYIDELEVMNGIYDVKNVVMLRYGNIKKMEKNEKYGG